MPSFGVWVKFNGIDLSDLIVVDSDKITGRGPLYQEITLQGKSAGDGSYFVKKKRPPRPLGVPFTLIGNSLNDKRQQVDELNKRLNVAGPSPMIFGDESDKTYFAILSGLPDWNEVAEIGQGTLSLICPDPDKIGQSKTVSLSRPLTIEGTAKTWPTIQIDFTAAASSFKVTNQDGKYVNVIYNFAIGDQLILDFSKRKITINGIVHMTALDWANSEWFALVPGDNTLTVTPDVATQITYTPRWL